MNKLLNTIFLIFVFVSISQAGDIISSAFVTSGVVSLGENVSIQFNVNQVSICDSYTTETSVDYLTKKIEVKVNYNYFSNCSESFLTKTEFVNKQILLEGIYNVEIVLNVPNDFNLDETIYLSSIFVNNPFNNKCNSPFIPYITDNCPLTINEVCACDGQNYNNECEAYLLNRNGIYNSTLCGIYIEQSSLPYRCDIFQYFKRNRFSKYSCSDDYYEGREIYLKYDHQENDSLIINFRSNTESVRLFLIKLVNNNIECLSMSDETKLEYADLPAGTYYIIADSKSDYFSRIEFCVKNSIYDKVLNENLIIYPNPINDFIGIKSNDEIKEIKIYDILGVEIYSNKFRKSEVIINNGFNPGIYFIQVETNNGIQTKKVVIN